MKPLSIYKYYLKSINKFTSLFVPVLLSIALLYTVQMLIDSTLSIDYRSYVEPQKYYSSISAKSKVLEPDLIYRVKSMEAAEYIMPWIFNYTNFNSNISGSIGTKVMTLRADDMKLLMDRMNLKVIEGRLPEPGTDEIILHKLVADNKKVTLGDSMGSSIERSEALQGERRAVGILDGESVVSFDSLETWMMENNVLEEDYSTGIILIPKEGHGDEVEVFFGSLHTEGLEVRTLDSVTGENTRDVAGVMRILTLIYITLIMIVSICCGFINYIYFYHRRTEYGILSALGYTRQQIINRAFREVSGIYLAAFLSGIILSIIGGIALNSIVFIPNGQPLELFNMENALKASCILVFATLFSIVPVWRMLKYMDPLTIIEGIT